MDTNYGNLVKYTSALLLAFILGSSSIEQNKTALGEDSSNSNSKPKAIVSSNGPSPMVRNVKQARNGDILVAAYNGVFRYDGKSFTNITSVIRSPSFWDVLEDRKGKLWFGTRDSGVYCYNGKTFQHFTTRHGLASNSALRVYEDRAGMIWFCTGGGLSRYDGKSFRNFTTEDGLSSNDVNTIMEDKTGTLWIGTRGDACFYDGETFTVFKNKDGKPFYNVWSIVEDKKGNIWFGGSIIKERINSTLYFEDGGLWRYDGSAYTRVSKRGAYAIIEDSKGNIWTTGAVELNGYWALSRYDQESLSGEQATVTEVMSIKGPGALCGIVEAKDGSIWFGGLGSGSGVHRYDGKTITDFIPKESLK